MSYTLRLSPGAPRYFKHASFAGLCESAFETQSVTLVEAAGDGCVVVSCRVDGGPSFAFARLRRGACEHVAHVHRFEGQDVRFSVRGGEVELRGVVEHLFHEDASEDDDESDGESDSEGLKGYGSDSSWGSDVEESREVTTTATAGQPNADEKSEEEARRNAVATSTWRGVDDIRATMNWWDADGARDDLAYHIQNPGARRSSRSEKVPQFAWTGSLRPSKTTPKRSYPSGLMPPDYAVSGWPDEEFASRYQSTVEVKPHSARDAMRAACSLARHVMDCVAWAIEPGVTTEYLDRICHAVTVGNGAYPSPLNYMGFPKSCCTSINEVVCHGVPDGRPLKKGDIVNLDITVRLNGYHGDLNETYLVGTYTDASRDAKRLMESAERALKKSIDFCRPGRRFRDIGEIIATEADKAGFASVKDFCGHGIGTLFHCAPNIPHYARNKAVGVMKEGMTFTIEPMFNASKSHKVLHWPDGWTAVTTDGALSAQYEHTLLITSDGVEVLTARTPKSRPFIM